jgi:Tfp pilus assembly protein PilF
MWLLVAFSLVSEGRSLFEKNQFHQARVMLQRAVEADRGNHEARYWLAFTYLALSEYESSVREFEHIEQRYVRDPEFLFAASEAYTRRARQLSDQLSAWDDSSARRHQHLAHRHLARHDQENALVELDLALQRNPRLRGLLEERAEILWMQRKFPEAVKSFQAELALNPAAFQANLRYGQYLLQERKLTEALVYLRVAAGHHRYPEAHQLLAYALQQLGRQGEAQAVIADGLQLFPGYLGLTEMQRSSEKPVPYRVDRPPAASPALANLRRQPSSDESVFWLHQIYSDRAVELTDRLEEVAPESARLAQLKGLNAEYIEDYSGAEHHYRDAVRRAPQTIGLRFALGHVLRIQGKDEEAEAELAREMQNHLTLYERGLIRSKQADFEGAVPLLEGAVKLSPSFVQAQTELAKAYLQTGGAVKAVPILKSVIQRQPEHPSAHFLLGRAYRSLDQPDLAQRELELHRRLMERTRSAKRGAGGMPE